MFVCRRKALNLPEQIKLLPGTEDDTATAKLAFYSYEASGGSAAAQQVSVGSPMSARERLVWGKG